MGGKDNQDLQDCQDNKDYHGKQAGVLRRRKQDNVPRNKWQNTSALREITPSDC